MTSAQGGRSRVTGSWLAACALAWLAGTLLQLQQERLPPAGLAAFVGALGIAACGVAVKWPSRLALRWLGLVGVAAIAGAAADLRGADRLSRALDPTLEGVDLVVTGVVSSLPQRATDGLRFRLDVESATQGGTPVTIPPRLSVGWYRNEAWRRPSGPAPQAGPPRPRASERWRYTLRLRSPHGLMNPQGGDIELRLFEEGIGATAAVRDRPTPERLDAVAGYPIQRLRQRVRDAIDAQVPDRRAAGILAALAVGDQGAIDPADRDLYRRTGIAHLVAISGLHIAMLGWLAGAVTGRAWRLGARAMLRVPVPLAAALGAWTGALGYALISGWGVPAQRTFWMLAVVTACRLFGWRWPWHLTLGIAAVAVTCFDPWALIQPGFWLSFTAVGLLQAAALRTPETSPMRATWPRRAIATLRDGLRTQLVATVGLAPLTLILFQQVSVVGLAANLVAIPVVTLLVTPCALLGALLPPLWTLAAWALGPLNAFLTALANLPGAVLTLPAAPAWAQGLGLAGAVLLILPTPWRLRLLALPLLLPMAWPPRELPPPGGYDLTALDIGQGTAVVVRTRSHLLVFDTGPPYGPDDDAGRRVLLPWLRAAGETRIDRLVLSHRDTDHVGGAASLLDALPVALLEGSLPPDHRLLGRAERDAPCQAGETWDWDGVRFEMLHPTGHTDGRKARPNTRSCVLRVSAGPRSVLLTGDIEQAQEAELTRRLGPAALRSGVLFAPHHGSKTSSSPAFLDAVQPHTVIFQAGYRNRYGHPAPEVTRRYLDRRIRTVACGAWRQRWDGAAAGTCFRDDARRYWHHRPTANEREKLTQTL